MIVVAAAVVYALTFLPALLAILGPRVDALRVPFVGRPGGRPRLALLAPRGRLRHGASVAGA